MPLFHLPALRGGLLALAAAALFGISTPLVQRAGAGLGAFTTAALLYAGAAFMGAWLRQPVEREAALRRADLKRLSLMALFGAVIGPWRSPGACSTPAAPAPRSCSRSKRCSPQCWRARSTAR